MSTWVLALSSLLSSCTEAPPESKILPEPESALRPQELGGGVLAEARIADYQLEAHLDTEKHRVTGTARVLWRNTTDLTVNTVPFHLYMNGFRAEDTAWMSNALGRHRRSVQHEDGPWGYIDVTEVSMASGVEGDPESPGAAPISLPFRENADPSTMQVELPVEVGPGQQIELELTFVTQLPKVVARTGFGDSFHSVAQWYPKIGVLDENGWQAHTFTPNDEFYADFGNYHVELDVPADVIVGATGIRTAEVELEGDRKRLTYEAEMVHDFVWMTDPDFVIVDGEHKGIRIRQLIQPDFVETAPEHEASTIAALDAYEQRYGPYPWSTITIVHPPEEAEGAGGMEYPTLFTTSDRADIPGWFRRHVMDERVSGLFTTVHEFGHQYFQGLFASREHEQPWLDEGLNSMSNILAYMDRFEDPWVMKVGNQKLYQTDVLGLMVGGRRANVIPVDSPASVFAGLPGSYSVTIYQKTATLMLTLRNLIGHEAFDAIFREYGERARFRHPRGRDLEALFIERLGQSPALPTTAVGETVELDLEAYFEQALRTVRIVDFSLASLRHQRLVGQEGWRRDEHGTLVGGEEAPEYLDKSVEEMDDSEVKSVVRIERIGYFHIPVELEVEFEDGTTERRIWNGHDPYKIFEWPERRVVRAELDPDHKLLLEHRRLDNVRLFRPRDGEKPDDGLSRPLAELTEAISWVVLGGLLP